jgi:ribosomal protein S18 acetylase RimI-like enzyme
MKPTVIAQATVPSLPALTRLFTQATQQHFDYFPLAVRKRVISEHSVHKLLLATLDSRRVVLTARQDRRIVGYCLGATPKTGAAQIYWLYVDPDHRGSNIGLSLLSRMLKLLGQKGARDVSIATHDHRRYYERQGFKFRRKTLVDSVQMDILTFRINS